MIVLKEAYAEKVGPNESSVSSEKVGAIEAEQNRILNWCCRWSMLLMLNFSFGLQTQSETTSYCFYSCHFLCIKIWKNMYLVTTTQNHETKHTSHIDSVLSNVVHLLQVWRYLPKIYMLCAWNYRFYLSLLYIFHPLWAYCTCSYHFLL